MAGFLKISCCVYLDYYLVDADYVPGDQSVPGPFYKSTWADTRSIKIVTVTGNNAGKDVYNGTGSISDDHTIPEDHNVVPDQHYGERNKDTITHDIESQIKTINYQDESREDEWIVVEGKNKNSKAHENAKSTTLAG